ncbi:MAG: thioredoxin fold domain-containing protein [Gammaproteobacteria bacterium]|nr:thioredoxin fold domain-containing protein [Gammaproteobacteria bacterium]
MRKHWFLLIGIIFASFQAVLAAPPEGYRFLNLTDALRQSGAEHKPMFLYFGRYGCSTCRKMHKEVFSDAGLMQEFNDEFILAYVDTESDNRIRLANGERTTEMQFATRSRILGTPTFVYFAPDQKPLFQKAGFQTVQQLTKYNSFMAEGIYKTTSLEQYLAIK